MPKTVLIDELHFALRVPAGLTDRQARTVRRPLLGAAFLRRLRHVVRGTVRTFPDLSACRVTVTR